MSDDTTTPDNPKDGFDLIEYPTNYLYKAMCRAVADRDSRDLIRDLVLMHVSEADLLETRVAASRTGKFESVTVTVRLTSRVQLESIYRELADCPNVVMTL